MEGYRQIHFHSQFGEKLGHPLNTSCSTRCSYVLRLQGRSCYTLLSLARVEDGGSEYLDEATIRRLPSIVVTCPIGVRLDFYRWFIEVTHPNSYVFGIRQIPEYSHSQIPMAISGIRTKPGKQSYRERNI